MLPNNMIESTGYILMGMMEPRNPIPSTRERGDELDELRGAGHPPSPDPCFRRDRGYGGQRETCTSGVSQ